MRQETSQAPGLETQKLVLLLDRSSEMPWDEALPSLAAFLNLLQLGNRFAVLGYRQRATPIFPLEDLALYNERAILDEATQALLRTTAGGLKSNLSAALKTASNRLAAEELPKTIVLVAASEWNTGTDPLLDLPSFPVQTIALGDHGQQETLRAIATETGGRYTFAPDVEPLMAILIELIEQLGIAQILTIGSKTIGNQQSYSLVGRVPEGATRATFLVYWGNPAITYGTASGPRWVTTELVDPAGKPNPDAPLWASNGFAVFGVDAPQPGSWSLKSTYVGAGTCSFTNAILFV